MLVKQKALLRKHKIPSTRKHSHNDFFSFKGRINSWRYLFSLVVACIAYSIIFFACQKLNNIQNTMLWPVVAAVPFLVFIMVITIKRFYDMNRWRRNIFFLLIPVYNIWLGIRLLFKRWSRNENKYGQKPQKLSVIMKIVIIVLWAAYLVLIGFYI